MIHLLNLAEDFGFTVLPSDRKVIHRKDIGKGGWSNTIQQTPPIISDEGDFEVYIAKEEPLAIDAFEANRRHDDETVGRLLRIPQCCRHAYSKYSLLARRKQNDFVALVAGATQWPPPFDSMTNYVSQYFGWSLLSHFPCSFRCKATHDLAGQIHDTLASISMPFADAMRQSHVSNILYTEYSGIVSFPGTRMEINNNQVTLAYGASDLRFTASSPILEAIRAGDSLRASACNDIEIFRGSSVVGRLYGDDFALCLFN